MKHNFFKRILTLALTVCLLLTMMPLSLPVMDVEAVSGINSLTCSGYISNTTARNYIDTMMRYYINANSKLQTALNNGQSVVFMFEGGSDNYWSGSDYTNSAYDVRDQAVCFVVKMNSSGNAYIAFCSEMCSSIPGDPTWCTNGVAYSGSTTILDGIYSFYTWNHTGPYAAFQVDMSATSGYAYYTPYENRNGYKAGASGINIHTRSSNIAAGSDLGWAWSEGCQVIGTGGYTGNEFNAFVKSITGITWNPWIDYPNKVLNTWGSVGAVQGYYVLDRQLALSNISGTKYGSGSMIALYNQTALNNITASSKAAKDAAGAGTVDYLSQCTYYPAYGKLKCTGTDVWSRTLPCYASVDSSTAAISQFNSGDELTATGLYKNTVGEYWYRVLSASGTALYIRAAYMEFVEQYTSDITFSGHTKPNGHVKGEGFVVDGTIASTYNQLTAVSAYVHDGLGTKGATETGHRATVSTTKYTLAGSDVDNNTWMNVMDNGPHTLAITAEYKNCYVENDTTLKTNTGKIVLAEDYFMVIPSAKSQSSCSHTYQTYPIDGASTSCTVSTKAVKGCTTCGLMGDVTTTVGEHKYGEWVVTDATCTQSGSKVRTCSACGNKETQAIAATGHSYTSKVEDANCQSLGQRVYTCTKCSHSYSEPVENQYSEWSLTKPQGVDESLIETKTQYRYSDYKEFTSYNASESGYTQVKKTWEESSKGEIPYVPSWPGGFDKTNSLYSKYNGTKTTASESANAKREITYDGRLGFLYYHWCYSGSFYSYESKQGNYTTFHAYYSTTYPSNYECDTSDMSYKTSNTSCCSNSEWYFVADVYLQRYTDYKALYTHGGYGEWSSWSDTPVTASDTRKVETRTMYRYAESSYGDHVFENNYCTVCGMREPNDNLYLFGYINGADYGCNNDADNTGEYIFVNGKLTATFTENSYVAVKTGDNSAWYMTDGYPGDNVTSATLYNTNSGINADKLFVPKGREITFTLTDNGNDTFTLSYVAALCEHTSHTTDGVCTTCGESVEHTFDNGACTLCGKPCDHNYSDGVCTVCGIVCDHSFAEGECTVCHKICTHHFENGECTICSIPCEHNWDNGTCTLCGQICSHEWHDGVCTICTVNCEHSYTEGACTICGKPCEHHFTDSTCDICGTKCDHDWQDSQCTHCGKVCDVHSFVNGKCAICSKTEPDYYLFGYINGADYGFGDDENNIGIYKFKNGKLTAVFTENSYVAMKTGDNSSWYMADGYPGDGVTSVTLYNTDSGINAEKLFVPKGRLITFTLTYMGNDTYTLSYEAESCSHSVHGTDGICATCGENVEHTYRNGRCIVCGLSCSHSFAEGECTVCGKVCEHIWIDGECVLCEAQCDHSFAEGVCTICEYECEHSYENGSCGNCGISCEHRWHNGECVICDTQCEHSFADGGCTTCGKACNHSFEEGECTTCGKPCEHSFTHGTCDICGVICEHSWSDGECTVCGKSCEHSFAEGECTTCGKPCTHQWTEGECTACGTLCEHSFENGVCTLCGLACEHNLSADKCTLCGKTYRFYLVGNIDNTNVGFEENYEFNGQYVFTDGALSATFNYDSYVFLKTDDNNHWFMTDSQQKGESATFYSTQNDAATEMMFIPGGTKVDFTLVHNSDGTITLSYDITKCMHNNHNHNGDCVACGVYVGHTYVSGTCMICKAEKPVPEMYLFGYINGADYACESDFENLGVYRFEDGKLTVTFTEDSYVGVKTGDNNSWYMTDGWLGYDTTSATLYKTDLLTNADKLYVPGGVEVSFTLTANSNDTLTLSYKAEKKPVAEINAKYTTLSVENEIMFNVYYSLENFDTINPDDMGILVFAENNPEGTVDTATDIISGATDTDGKLYSVHTKGINPMYLGDTLYVKIYAKLSDGSFVYSDIINCNAVSYAKTVLNNPNSTKAQKSLMVAMLNYAAEAQKYFGYKTDELVNDCLTAEQKTLVANYSANMAANKSKVDSGKLGDFKKSGGNTLLYPTVSFEDTLFTINYNCKTSLSADGDITLYYWDTETYSNATQLTVENASGYIIMEKSESGIYVGTISDIAAKDLAEALYVSAVYTADGETYCSGVIAYSLAEYCKIYAGNSSSDMQALAQAAIVYGYYAKNYFA